MTETKNKNKKTQQQWDSLLDFLEEVASQLRIENGAKDGTVGRNTRPGYPQDQRPGSGKGQGLQEHGSGKECVQKQGGWGGAGLGQHLGQRTVSRCVFFF